MDILTTYATNTCTQACTSVDSLLVAKNHGVACFRQNRIQSPMLSLLSYLKPDFPNSPRSCG